MLTHEDFGALVAAAARAPSADNMQGWEFARQDDAIEVFLARQRQLPTDVNGMFGWVGLGAAIENLVIAASRRRLAATVEYGELAGVHAQPAVVRLTPGRDADPLADWIDARATNRSAYDTSPLSSTLRDELTGSVRDLAAGVHWVTGQASLDRMADLDARATYIRLEHRPLHDELFSILRFTREELERTRYGLDFASIGVPAVFVFMARLLRFWSVNQLVSRLGVGRLNARLLAARLRTAGALCLVTARRQGPAGYVEAGRAMERLWLAANARGLAVQPHGVLPQYLTKVALEPESFLPRHAATLRGHRAPFDALFPAAADERPAIVLRIGRPLGGPAQRTVRLQPEQIIRKEGANT